MTDSPDVQALLDKARRGLSWLRRAHYAWLDDRPVTHPEEEFARVLDETAGMEAALRAEGYQGCILGDQGSCPEDAVITCDRCAGIAGPKELEPPHPPAADAPAQLSLFKVPSQHP